jgi:hypothetical protein
VSKAASDIRNDRYRRINVTSNAFAERVANCPAAMKVLQIAGFRPTGQNQTIVETPEESTVLELQHYNVAILNMLSQVRLRRQK